MCPLVVIAGKKTLRTFFKGFHTFKGRAGERANPGKSIPYALDKGVEHSG